MDTDAVAPPLEVTVWADATSAREAPRVPAWRPRDASVWLRLPVEVLGARHGRRKLAADFVGQAETPLNHGGRLQRSGSPGRDAAGTFARRHLCALAVGGQPPFSRFRVAGTAGGGVGLVGNRAFAAGLVK